MEKKETFTNETLSKKFKNIFDLVNYAISLAENMIKSGREPRVKRKDMQNRAMLILEEIKDGKDEFVEILNSEGQIDHDYDAYKKHESIFEKPEYKKLEAGENVDDE